MLYQKKIDRAMDLLKEKNKGIGEKDILETDEVKDEEAGLQEMELASTVEVESDNHMALEKNDRLAMILSALFVFLPFVLIIGVIGAVLIYLITLL